MGASFIDEQDRLRKVFQTALDGMRRLGGPARINVALSEEQVRVVVDALNRAWQYDLGAGHP